ncbi:hypothetical protein AO458_04970 [Oenococcus oeni]|nr:hypothetical protein AO458_04970 [Oenococcus oeni]
MFLSHQLIHPTKFANKEFRKPAGTKKKSIVKNKPFSLVDIIVKKIKDKLIRIVTIDTEKSEINF